MGECAAPHPFEDLTCGGDPHGPEVSHTASREEQVVVPVPGGVIEGEFDADGNPVREWVDELRVVLVDHAWM